MIEFLFNLRFYTVADLRDSRVFSNYFSKDFADSFYPRKYDHDSRMRYEYDFNKISEISEFCYNSYGIEILLENEDLIIISELINKVSSIKFYIQNKSDYKNLLLFFFTKSNQASFLFTKAASFAEDDIKHKTIKDHGEGKTSEGAIGIRANDFLQYLPGIYSFTVFGTEIIEFFSRAKLEGMKIVFPNLEYFEGDNYFGFQIDDENQSLEKVIQIQKEIAQYLGQEYFFDRDLMGIVDFKPIPTILEKIK
jgi:hypothetical protein